MGHDRALCIMHGAKRPPIETHDAEFYRHEFERIGKGDKDTDRDAGIFDNLFLHD
ncbi:MAG: hypothetical protein JWL86_5155 [Rhizobium sp.]|nr:hypothetical protein [Rhizobium sp.]